MYDVGSHICPFAQVSFKGVSVKSAFEMCSYNPSSNWYVPSESWSIWKGFEVCLVGYKGCFIPEESGHDIFV